MKKNKTTKILIFIIVLNLVILFTFLIYKNVNKDENKTEIIKEKERDSTEYIRPELIYPMRVSEFSENYTGNISDEYILQKLTDYIYYIIDNKEYIDSIEENKISEEYNKNKTVLNNIGIESIESYKNLVTRVKQLPYQDLEYSYSEFVIETINNSTDKMTIDFNIKFLDIDEMKIRLNISNEYKKDSILIKITPVN